MGIERASEMTDLVRVVSTSIVIPAVVPLVVIASVVKVHFSIIVVIVVAVRELVLVLILVLLVLALLVVGIIILALLVILALFLVVLFAFLLFVLARAVGFHIVYALTNPLLDHSRLGCLRLVVGVDGTPQLGGEIRLDCQPSAPVLKHTFRN